MTTDTQERTTTRERPENPGDGPPPGRRGMPAGRVPDLATLLFGPMARGTVVGQS